MWTGRNKCVSIRVHLPIAAISRHLCITAMTSTDNRHSTPPSEADIQAYADGTLTPERTAALRDYLGKHPAEARRVAFYDRLNAQIQASFQTTEEPVQGHIGASHRLRMLLQPAARARRILSALVALALLLIAVSGWLTA